MMIFGREMELERPIFQANNVLSNPVIHITLLPIPNHVIARHFTTNTPNQGYYICHIFP